MKHLGILLSVLALTACAGVVTPSSTPSPALSPTAQPSVSPSASVVQDACHQGGVAYCVLNPNVTQATAGRTICVSGWTRTIRPPVTYTDSLKRQQLLAFGARHPNDPNWTLAGTEEDHRMPLELGGAARDPMNLSPEEPRSPNPKDRDESLLREMVCSGQMTLADAQRQLVARWLGSYPDYKEVQ